LIGRGRLTADERKFELMIFFDESGRSDNVNVLDGIRDLL
jgi:hypothetical protein